MKISAISSIENIKNYCKKFFKDSSPFISYDFFKYLEKTGCTFLRSKLLSIYPEKIFEEKTKHSLQVNRVSSPKIITIREPEAYYFSLWSYGIDHKGGFFNLIKLYYPEKLNIFYGEKTKDCF